MPVFYANDPKFDYPEVNRHWHALSEKYAGADCLLTAMHHGWTPSETVFFEEFWHAGSRPVMVYHFDLTRGDERMIMPVLSNPYLRRVLPKLSTTILSMDERERVRPQRSNGARG